MFEAVLEAELWTVKNYAQRAEEADKYGDKGLVVHLEDMVRDETGHSDETKRMLQDWPR
jgi:bacterioferritin